jgi:hypothetical protein
MSKKQVTKNDVLQALRKLAEKKGRDWLTCKEFVSESGIGLKQVLVYFDRWNEAVAQAGLRTLDRRGRPDKKRGYSKEELLNLIGQLAKKLKRNYVAKSEFTEETGIIWRPIHRLFGGWEQFAKQAGLGIHPAHKIKIQDISLFKEYFRITEELDRFPSYTEFARRSDYSIGVYENRFGNFTEFRKHALKYGLDNGLIKPEIAQPAIESIRTKSIAKRRSYEPLGDRPVLGERIDFRGLLHAPVNELGVVYLFGILSEDLGFIVESVQSGFPDCEGKRRLKNNRWQRVRIEFEYISSNFVVHQHDITKCDLIICWEHDWKNCPLEVISLKEHLETIER